MSYVFPTRKISFSISPAAAAGMCEAPDDWSLVLRFAHWDGLYFGILKPLELRELRFLADGFGDLRNSDHPEWPVLLRDWSHVRDSSPEAVARMAGWIRAWVEHYTA